MRKSLPGKLFISTTVGVIKDSLQSGLFDDSIVNHESSRIQLTSPGNVQYSHVATFFASFWIFSFVVRSFTCK